MAVMTAEWAGREFKENTREILMSNYLNLGLAMEEHLQGKQEIQSSSSYQENVFSFF